MNLTIILAILVAILCIKWVILALSILVFSAEGIYARHKDARWAQYFHLPVLADGKLMLGGWMRWTLYQIGLLPSIGLRRCIYRIFGASIGKKAIIHFRAEIRCPANLKIGKGTIVGDNAILDARHGLTIGANVNMSSNVSLYTLQHDYRDPDFGMSKTRNGKPLAITIYDRAWLGPNVIVLPGVTIGEGAVCCAGCVVTEDVEPYTVVAGIPAKQIATRPSPMTYEFSGRCCAFY